MKDQKIAEAYNSIYMTTESADRILSALEQTSPSMEGEAAKMKRKPSVSILLIAAVISVLLIGTAYAVTDTVHGTGTYYRGGEKEYTRLADLPKAEKVIGYPVTAPEEFSNGYQFSSMSIIGEAAFGEDLSVLKEYYSLHFTYTKQDSPDLYVEASPVLDLPTEHECLLPTEMRTINGIDVCYSLDHYKFVPEDYQVTEEDEAAKAAGHFYLSYGADEVQEYDYSFAGLTMEDVEYVIMSTEGLDTDTMFTMAEELIKAK